MAIPLGYPPPSLHRLRRAAQHPLFGDFFGTMGVSDFSPALMTGLRLPFPAPPDIPPSDTDETSQLLLK